MNNKCIIASTLVGAIFSFNTIVSYAQENSKLTMGIYSASLFRDNSSDHFFQGQMFLVAYEREFDPTIGAIIGLNTLSAMNTSGKHGGLTRYLYNHTELMAGSIFKVLNRGSYDFNVKMGLTIRNRKEVGHDLSIGTEYGNLTLDQYKNKWDLGLFLKLELSRIFKKRYSFGIESGFTTYNNEESILYVGLKTYIKL